MEAGGKEVIITGMLYKFGDDVNTDEIVPARYLNTSDAKELAAHVMEDADPQFPAKVKPGDIIVAGKNLAAALRASMRLWPLKPRGWRVWWPKVLRASFTATPSISG